LNNKTKIAFFILGFLAIGQVLWWAHLLTDQQLLIATLNPAFHEKSKHFSRMIVSETIFFIFFWSLSLWYTYKSYKEQLSLRKAHGSFLGGISHELKTPIANIQLCLETLARPGIDAEKKETYIQRAQSALDTLHEQVEDILTFTSLDTIKITNEKIKIKDLIEQEIKNMVHHGKVQTENIEIDISEKMFVQSPYLSSQLVVKNILDNAVKYSSKSGNKNIRIHGFKDSGKTVLTIQDNGIGMTKEEIEDSMKPFWRSERAIQEALPGTGMGLTLAQEIAHRSHMQIHFESEGINQGVKAKIVWENSL
jgi:two-component system phosphate regulon sensor histidine kinase PhoR